MDNLIRGIVMRTRYTRGRITSVDVLTDRGVLTGVLPPVFSVSKKLDGSGVSVTSVCEPVKGTPCIILEQNGRYQILTYTPDPHSLPKKSEEYVKDTSGDVRFFRTVEDKILTAMTLTESIASLYLTAPQDEEEPHNYYRMGLFSGMGEDKKIMGQIYIPRLEVRTEDTYLDSEKGWSLGTYKPKDPKAWPPEMENLVTEKLLPDGRIEKKLLYNGPLGPCLTRDTDVVSSSGQYREVIISDANKNYTQSKRTPTGYRFENRKNGKGMSLEVDGPDVRMKSLDGEFKMEVGKFEVRIKGDTLTIKGNGSDILNIKAGAGGNTVSWTPNMKHSVSTKKYQLRASDTMELYGKKAQLLDTPALNMLKLNKVMLADMGGTALLTGGGLPLTVQATTNIMGSLTVNFIPVVLLTQHMIHMHIDAMGAPTTPPIG